MLSTEVSASVSLEHSPINCSGRFPCFLNTEFTSIHANLVYQPKNYFVTIIMQYVITWISYWITHPDKSDNKNSLELNSSFVTMLQSPCINRQRPVLLCNRYWCWVSSSWYKELCSRHFVQQYWGMHTKNTAPLKLTELASEPDYTPDDLKSKTYPHHSPQE